MIMGIAIERNHSRIWLFLLSHNAKKLVMGSSGENIFIEFYNFDFCNYWIS